MKSLGCLERFVIKSLYLYSYVIYVLLCNGHQEIYKMTPGVSLGVCNLLKKGTLF